MPVTRGIRKLGSLSVCLMPSVLSALGSRLSTLDSEIWNPPSEIRLLSRICGCAACDAADFSPAFQRVPASKQAAVSRSRKTRPSEESLSGVIPDLPSRLHLRFALNLPGRSEGEGGRGVPPVEPERSPCHVFAPTDSAEEPKKVGWKGRGNKMTPIKRHCSGGTGWLRLGPRNQAWDQAVR